MVEGVTFILWIVYFYIGILIVIGWAWGWLALIPAGLLLVYWQGGQGGLFGSWLPVGMFVLERAWVAAISHSPYRPYALFPRDATAILLTGLSLGALLGPAFGTGIWAWLGSHSFRRFEGTKIIVIWTVTLLLRLSALGTWTGVIIASRQ